MFCCGFFYVFRACVSFCIYSKSIFGDLLDLGFTQLWDAVQGLLNLKNMVWAVRWWGCALLLAAMVPSFAETGSSDDPQAAWKEKFIARRAETAAAMAAALQGGTAADKAAACDFFRLTHDTSAIPLILNMLGESDLRLKERAVQALRGTGSAAMLPMLRAALPQSTWPPLTRALLAALGQWGEASDVALVKSFLNNPADSIRATAACALAMLGDADAAAVLEGLLDSPVPMAARLAVEGLSYCGDAASLARLTALAGDPGFAWREECEMGLLRRSLRAQKDAGAVEKQLAALAQSKSFETACWAMDELMRRDAPDTAAVLAAIAPTQGQAAQHARQLLMTRYGIDISVSPPPEDDAKHEAIAHRSFFAASYELLEQADCGTAGFFDENGYNDTYSGSYEEDDQDCDNQPCSLGSLCGSANRHFYNPYTGAGLPNIPLYSCNSGMQMTALQSALNHWGWMLTAFGNNEYYGYNKGFHLFGQAIHLLEDMSVPAHAHVDNHLDSFGDDYEGWFKAYFEGGGTVSPAGLEPWPAEGTTVESLMNGMAKAAYDLSAYDGELVEDPDEQQDYLDNEFGRMFKIAYYDGWWEDTRWEIRDRNNKLIGSYDPGSSIDLGGDEWWAEEDTISEFKVNGTKHIHAKYYVENLQESSTVFQPMAFDSSKLEYAQFEVGDSLFDVYAAELTPKLLRRCAAMMQLLVKTLGEKPVAILSPGPKQAMYGVVPVVATLGSTFEAPLLYVDGVLQNVTPVFEPPKTFQFLWDASAMGSIQERRVEVRAVSAQGACAVSDAVDVDAGNYPPSIAITAPAEAVIVSDDALPVAWEAADPDSNAAFYFFADYAGNGYGGQILPGQFKEDDDGGVGQALLDTSSLLDGVTYYLYARIDDGISQIYSDYSAAFTIQRVVVPEGEGQTEGSQEGVAEGSQEGTIEGEGLPEGNLEGFAEGADEGMIEGTPEGVIEGEGMPEGVMEGEGIPEGNLEGADEGEGVPEGVAEGSSEGSEEGIIEGFMEGVEEGSVEGVEEGVEEGMAEGSVEGVEEGAAEGNAEGTFEGAEEGVLEGEGQPEGSTCDTARHSADQNGNQRIELTELLRVIQFFNAGGLHCAAAGATEDGYAPGNGAADTCCPHASDYAPMNWQISLPELLRLIQFFNVGGYTPCPDAGTEDGYCPGLNAQ